MALFQRILCPVDFSETSMKAFTYADRLARESGAELVLVHAFEMPASYDPAGQYEPADQSLRERLEAATPATPAANVTRLMHAGPPGEVICWFASDQECDLIVMGTHGRGGLMHLLLGSVAEYVIRYAPCPVITIRDRPAKERPLTEPRVEPLPPPHML